MMRLSFLMMRLSLLHRLLLHSPPETTESSGLKSLEAQRDLEELETKTTINTSFQPLTVSKES